MSRRALSTVVAALALIPISLLGQESRSTASPLQGVWRAQEVVITGGTNPRTVKSPQPYLRIYTARHYSLVGITTTNGEARKPASQVEDVSKLTDAQKLERYAEWAPFAAQSGTYDVKGNTVTHHAIVAKAETAMSGKPNPNVTNEFKVDGKTLWLTTRNSQTKTETRIRFTRLE